MTAPKNDQQGCIFCIAAVEQDRRKTLTIHRDERALVMLNRYPYTNGHLMIAPIAHQARLFESDVDILTSVIRLTAVAQRMLADVYTPDGFNVGMNFGQVAGAGVADHYHMHVVPRWSGDTNFMTTVGQTRVLPEELHATAARLRPIFERLGS